MKKEIKVYFHVWVTYHGVSSETCIQHINYSEVKDPDICIDLAVPLEIAERVWKHLQYKDGTQVYSSNAISSTKREIRSFIEQELNQDLQKQNQQLYWMKKAKEYAKSALTESTIPMKEQWQLDALYVAYLKGVEEALHIRIIT